MNRRNLLQSLAALAALPLVKRGAECQAEPPPPLADHNHTGAGGQTATFLYGTAEEIPDAGIAGRLYLATDVRGGTLYRDDGKQWAGLP